MAGLSQERIRILGVPVDCVDMSRALSFIEKCIEEDKRATVLAVNPEKVMTARRDERTLNSLNEAGLLIPDGIGVVWAAKFLAGKKIGRVAGADLMPEVCGLAERNRYRVFLYGAAPGIADRVVKVLQSEYPDLLIAGAEHGFLAEGDMPELIARINAAKADVLFVALGSPRQELWIEKYSPNLGIKVYQGVGGTFNVLAGEVRRAPALFRKLNLEWFYRLITEPSRVSRQIILPYFGLLVIWQKLRQALP